MVLQNTPEKTVIQITKINSAVCDDPGSLSLEFESNVLSNNALRITWDTIVSQLTKTNPLKRPSPNPFRKYMPVKVIPLNFFTDDMSGNRTKKHNKFDSWIMVPAALPLSERHALENTAFVCTDHSLSAMQMLPAIVEDFVLLENGVEMMLPEGESVVVTAPLQFITADNARHSEIASSRGAISKMPCRKCIWQLKTPARFDGLDYQCPPRSESVVAAMHNSFLTSGDASHLVNVDTGYKLVGGEVLLKLKSFNTMLDCPIELLHTIMLGVGKALVSYLLKDHLTPPEKAILETKLFGYVSKGFARQLRSSLRLHGSFLGRGYKTLMQQIPILLNHLMVSGEIRNNDDGLRLIGNCFNDLGNLVSLSYISKIKFNHNLYLKEIASTYDSLRRSVILHDSFIKYKFPRRKGGSIYNSSKMHILHHLCNDISRFGSPIFYKTEKGEQFNKFIRECLFHTNRHNPSRDSAVAFVKRMMTRHILTGGSWTVTGQSVPVKASSKVLQCAASFESTIRNFADNDDGRLLVKVGSTGIFKNKNSNFLVGEVCKVDAALGEYTVVEYALLCGQEETVTRFTDNANCSVYRTFWQDAGGNLVVKKLQTKSTIKETEGQFVEMLAISRKLNDCFHVINTSKFGTFWWALSHKKVNL